DSAINVMIINSQAFNARGKDARRINMKLDEFRSRKPIDILAQTNPILIIDEPQSVEGKATKEGLKSFKPLMTLRYSATHKSDSVYNMVYRLDALDAYNRKLVKKIAVKGISDTQRTGTEGYVYLESINLSSGNPTATIRFDVKRAQSINECRRIVREKDSLFELSGELDEYKEGYVVRIIDGRDNSIEFINGLKLFAGDVIGQFNDGHLRRIQIRETILSHLERERQLFHKDIKVLSLFFIDEVAKYKCYDKMGQPFNGEYAKIFEEEYIDVISKLKDELDDETYVEYLKRIPVGSTHAGYFSIDKKKNQLVDCKLSDKKEGTTDDIDAYDLIMKDKERLLDFKEPVRFIFSHSALREGWDNPNVFQICTLKQSGSDMRKRQEVGRGLRLSVNQNGDRMDVSLLGEDVHRINVLTVIASESYEDFSNGLQKEIAEAVADRPRVVSVELFRDKVIYDTSGTERILDSQTAQIVYEKLIRQQYVEKGQLTEKYYEDKKSGKLELAEEVTDCKKSVTAILESVYNPLDMQVENARANNVILKLNEEKLNSNEFKALWERINSKSVYMVNFEEDELIEKSVKALNSQLSVSKPVFKIEKGEIDEIKSKEQLQSGEAFTLRTRQMHVTAMKANPRVKYDLIGKMVAETRLTRKTVVKILKDIDKKVFDQFENNPEEFILRAATIINEQKATVIIQHIKYNKLDSVYETDIFTDSTMKGRLDVNAIEAKKHLYDYVLYDSKTERKFAEEAETRTEVAVYVKLPSGFFINTPVGKYNPDWAIAFYEGTVKHIYFVAETKGDLSTLELRKIEEIKTCCAQKHFQAIGNGEVQYHVVDCFESLLKLVN
ncbi:MAG: hypothetical protein PHR66_14840, partial [Desulfuromonadaceae bacterium]|nr:hypothetical protein [Desulfuromonadaceae bacterium]